MKRKQKKSENPKVSVIVPVYNVEKYLRECLDSIVNQTLKDIEIICVDDGSTDSSPEILKEYAAKDKRITVLEQVNKYAGAARNAGIAIAKGEYLSFLDSDDIFALDMLEKLYNKAVEENADCCVCRFQRYNNGEILPATYNIREDYLPSQQCFSPRDIAENIFQTFVGWPWDKLYKRSTVEKYALKFQALHHSNDTYFVLMFLALSDRITYISDVLVNYRIHGSSLAHTKDAYANCFALALKQLYKGLKEHHIFEIYKNSFRKYVTHFAKWHISTMNSPKAKKAVQKYLNNLVKYICVQEYGVWKGYKKYLQLKNDYCCLGERTLRYSIKLFFCWCLYGWEQYGGRKVWKIFGLPIFKRRIYANGITRKYYILGLPVMKVSRKNKQ